MLACTDVEEDSFATRPGSRIKTKVRHVQCCQLLILLYDMVTKHLWCTRYSQCAVSSISMYCRPMFTFIILCGGVPLLDVFHLVDQGAVALSLKVFGTSFLFVTSHLTGEQSVLFFTQCFFVMFVRA